MRSRAGFSPLLSSPCAHVRACQNVDQLKLKIVVHSGEAVFHTVGAFDDVSGVDVILAHRLLKNSIPSNEYVLMTESAYRDIELERSLEVDQGEEHYEGFGAVRTFTYQTEGASEPKPEAVERLYENRSRAFATALRILSKGYFGQLQVLLGPQNEGQYSNLGDVRTTPTARAVMAARVVLLAPILVPIGAAIQAYRSSTRSTRAKRRRTA